MQKPEDFMYPSVTFFYLPLELCNQIYERVLATSTLPPGQPTGSLDKLTPEA